MEYSWLDLIGHIAWSLATIAAFGFLGAVTKTILRTIRGALRPRIYETRH